MVAPGTGAGGEGELVPLLPALPISTSELFPVSCWAERKEEGDSMAGIKVVVVVEL
jgi:hypothetical protein